MRTQTSLVEINQDYILRDAGVQVNSYEFPIGYQLANAVNALQHNFKSLIVSMLFSEYFNDTVYENIEKHLTIFYRMVNAIIAKEIEKVISDTLILNIPKSITLSEKQKTYDKKYGQFIEEQISEVLNTMQLQPEVLKENYIKNHIITTRFTDSRIWDDEQREKKLLKTIILNLILCPFQTHYLKLKEQIAENFLDPSLKEVIDFFKHGEPEWYSEQTMFQDLILIKWACQFSWPPIKFSNGASKLTMDQVNNQYKDQKQQQRVLINVLGMHSKQYNETVFATTFNEQEMFVLLPDFVYSFPENKISLVKGALIMPDLKFYKKLNQSTSTDREIPASTNKRCLSYCPILYIHFQKIRLVW